MKKRFSSWQEVPLASCIIFEVFGEKFFDVLFDFHIVDEFPLVVDTDCQILVFIQRLWFVGVYARVVRIVAASAFTDLVEVVAVDVVDIGIVILS